MRGLLEEINEISSDTEVVSVEEGSRVTSVTSSTSSTDSVGVLGDVGWEIVKNDVGDVGDIETTGGDGSGNEDRSSTSLEGREGGLSLSLGSVTVNRGGVVALGAKEVAQTVGHSLSLDEDEDKSTRLLGHEKIKEERLLVVVVDVLDPLGDVLGSGTDSSNGKEDVLLQEGSGEHLDLLGEGGGEHESLSLIDARHVLTLDDSSDLGLETHIKHSIGLIEDEVLDVGKTDSSSLHQVDKTSGSSREEIATSVKSSDLLSNVGTTVDDRGSGPRSVGELSSLVVDLRDKLTGGGEDKSGGVDLSSSVASLGRRGHGTVGEHGGKDGEEETTSLSGTGLGTSHQVSSTSDNGDRVLLDRSRGGVSGVANILQENGVDGRVRELGDGLRNSVTSSLNGDVGVLVEVDTGGLVNTVTLLAVELHLHALVSLTNNVTVPPGSESRGSAAATKASGLRSRSGSTPSAILAGSGGTVASERRGDVRGTSGSRGGGRSGETLLGSVTIRSGGKVGRGGGSVGRGLLDTVAEVRGNVGRSLGVQRNGLCGMSAWAMYDLGR